MAIIISSARFVKETLRQELDVRTSTNTYNNFQFISPCYFETCSVNQSINSCCDNNKAIVNRSVRNSSPFALTAVAYL